MLHSSLDDASQNVKGRVRQEREVRYFHVIVARCLQLHLQRHRQLRLAWPNENDCAVLRGMSRWKRFCISRDQMRMFVAFYMARRDDNGYKWYWQMKIIVDVTDRWRWLWIVRTDGADFRWHEQMNIQWLQMALKNENANRWRWRIKTTIDAMERWQ